MPPPCPAPDLPECDLNDHARSADSSGLAHRESDELTSRYVVRPSPRQRNIAVKLVLHSLGVIMTQAIWFGIVPSMSMLVRKRFDGGDYQTVLITAALPTLLMMSVFWNVVLQRMTPARYFAVHWASMAIPLAIAGLADSFTWLFVFYALACVGASGWSPIAGELLKRLYGDNIRGRAFGLVTGAMYAGAVATNFGIGRWLDVNADAFRSYFLINGLIYACGCLILARLAASPDDEELLATRLATLGARRMRDVLKPLLNVSQVLRSDPNFARYEGAFMTYGVGWMICNALLPILADERLKVTYSQFTESTYVPYYIALLVMLMPMGALMDRLGAARTSALSFMVLAIYPIGLALTTEISHLVLASVCFGATMAGVQMGWMLGPVALAPSPERVSEYVAIHTTLVGLRGLFAQVIGVILYRATNDFTVPFLIASLSLAWAARQMWQLHRIMSDARKAAEATSPTAVTAR